MNTRALAAVLALFTSAALVSAAPRPEVARLVPPDAISLAGADLQALRGSLLFERIFAQLPIPSPDGMLAKLNLNPREDLDRVYFASAAQAADQTLLILEGRFDGAAAGFHLRRIRFEGTEAVPWTFVVLDDQTAVAGPDPLVVAAIDRWKAQAGAPSTPALTAIEQEDAHLWALSFDPQSLLAPWIDRVPGGGGPLRALVSGMQRLAARGNVVAGGVQAELSFLCAGPDDARSLADAAQALAAVGALGAQHDRPELAKLLGQLQVHQQGAETTLSVHLAEQDILSLH